MYYKAQFKNDLKVFKLEILVTTWKIDHKFEALFASLRYH